MSLPTLTDQERQALILRARYCWDGVARAMGLTPDESDALHASLLGKLGEETSMDALHAAVFTYHLIRREELARR